MCVNPKENKMGTMPIRRLVLHMSWPMMLSMLVQALYNMVDSYFVAQISQDAFEALALVYPIQSLIIAIQAGTGVGVNTMLSRRLGEGKQEEAASVGEHGYFLYTLSWLVFLTVGWTFARPFLELYSDNPQVIEYGVTYLRIIVLFSLGSCLQFAAERVLQASGNPVGPMFVQGTGAVVNLILDPILIFGLGPIPRMEVAGAAIATGLGQLAGMGVGLFLVARNPVVHLSLRSFRPSAATVGTIYRIGLPAIVMQSLFTLMTLGMNKILVLFTQNGVFIMGAYFKVQSFVFMPVFGLNNGLTPVVSYNYGAKEPQRITGAVRFSLILSTGIMLLGMIPFLCFPQALLALFDAGPDVIAEGVPAMRMLCLCFVFSGIVILLCSAFQALGAPMLSLLFTLVRQVILLFPVALLLGYLAGPRYIWLCFTLCDGLGAVAALALYRWLYRERIAPLALSHGGGEAA
ncbi:MAG TPA: MATE family efflux transporter [Candidatus Flavonifractor merdigallinarum]|uniref:MATE family efflux transporter n=1 Tax=Candidatus Flavonifractor merdigallinarum TaxID=2838589 RepID=A0A9D1YA87_9FIRM|nr:MATE family efflux transporter [Candidatus Flavonifractor merdigallinarum]